MHDVGKNTLKRYSKAFGELTFDNIEVRTIWNPRVYVSTIGFLSGMVQFDECREPTRTNQGCSDCYDIRQYVEDKRTAVVGVNDEDYTQIFRCLHRYRDQIRPIPKFYQGIKSSIVVNYKTPEIESLKRIVTEWMNKNDIP